MTFAELLTDLRVARGVSQERLAAVAKVSVRAISDLERGITRRPQRDTVRCLAAALELDDAERDRFEQAARAHVADRLGRRPHGDGVTRVNLTAPVTSIVGRAVDIDDVIALLQGPDRRLVTITGPGGVGKSRLALAVGWHLAPSFERVDGVDLSPVASPIELAPAMAAAMGDRTGATASVAALATRIGGTAWLLVLDGFEHVSGAASDVAYLLARCPRLRVLATSRSPLRLTGEHVWPLAPLPVPTADWADLASVLANPAVTLLVERAQAVRPGFRVGESNAADVVALCGRCDGLPLAIELAAARLRTQEPGELAALLLSLQAHTVDTPSRHRSVRAAIGWSTQTLSHTDQLMLGVLAVYPGGAYLSSVREVVGALNLSDVDHSVTALAAASLVTVADQDNRIRVTMLDTIREIALETLSQSGLAPAVHEAQARQALELVAGSDGRLEQVDAELDNIRAALAWVIGNRPALLDAGVVRALSAYFTSRGYFPEALRTFTAIAAGAPTDSARAYALHGAGIAANESAAHDIAVEHGQRAVEIFARVGDQAGQCAALSLIGNAYKASAQYPRAREAHQRCLELARQAGDAGRVGIALNNLGTLAHDVGQHDVAERHYAESLDVKRKLGDERGIGVALLNLSDLANDRGEYAVAEAHGRRAVEVFRSGGELRRVAHGLTVLAGAVTGLGRLAEAVDLATEALHLARRVQHRPAVGLAEARLADVARARGDQATAARHYRAALDDLNDANEISRVLDALAVSP